MSKARSTPFSVTCAAFAEVHAAREFADDFEVQVAEAFAFERGDAGAGDLQKLDRADVNEKAESLAQSEQAGFGSFSYREGVPLGPPTAPRKIASALRQASSVETLGSGVLPASMAAPPTVTLQIELVIEFLAAFAQDGGGGLGDFRADAVAWQQDDGLLHGRGLSDNRGGRSGSPGKQKIVDALETGSSTEKRAPGVRGPRAGATVG